MTSRTPNPPGRCRENFWTASLPGSPRRTGARSRRTMRHSCFGSAWARHTTWDGTADVDTRLYPCEQSCRPAARSHEVGDSEPGTRAAGQYRWHLLRPQRRLWSSARTAVQGQVGRTCGGVPLTFRAVRRPDWPTAAWAGGRERCRLRSTRRWGYGLRAAVREQGWCCIYADTYTYCMSRRNFRGGTHLRVR